MATLGCGDCDNGKRQAAALSMAPCSDPKTPAKRIKLPHDQPNLVTPRQTQEENESGLSQEERKALLWNEAQYNCDDPSLPQKRREYLSWEDYFVAIAVLSSRRSKDPKSPAGACVVDSENRVVGIGYNGFPRDCSDDCLPWVSSSSAESSSWLHTQEPYVCHAEVNAILNKCSASVAGGRLYVGCYPCNECAKIIIQSGIQEIVYTKEPDFTNDTYKASRILLTMAGVKTRYYEPSVTSVSIDFVKALAPTTCESPICLQEVPSSKDAIQKHRKLLIQEAQYDPAGRPPTKRSDYLSWDDYFMAVAFLTAKRSKDPNTQVGACLVGSNKRILGLGYNGFPRGCSDDELPWARTGESELHKKYLYVCHAEVNAILNKCSADAQGATLYVALFPCNDCAKVLIQAGVREVVYMQDFYHATEQCRASRIMLQMAGIKLRRYIPTMQSLDLRLE